MSNVMIVIELCVLTVKVVVGVYVLPHDDVLTLHVLTVVFVILV